MSNKPANKLEQWGGRKFIFTIMSFIALCVMMLTGKMTQTNFVEALQWIAGAFGAGSGLEWIGKGLANQGGSSPPPVLVTAVAPAAPTEPTSEE